MTATLRRLAVSTLAAATLACIDRDAPPVDTGADVDLRVRTAERFALNEIGADTLTDAMRIIELIPEEDGDALAIIFSDAERGVHRALAVSDRATVTPQLLWPDSVTAVWWPGLHRLAFSTATGEGVRVVVNVHSESLELVEEMDSAAVQPRQPVPGTVPLGAAERATAFVDSLRRQQPGQYAEQSGLRYAVDTLKPSPDGIYVAFHVTAVDRTGGTTNPAWYMLHVRSGVVREIDSVTGPLDEMPPAAGAWVRRGSFAYARGYSVWEAEVSSDQTGD